MNWNDIPYINMEQPYWSQSVRENMQQNSILLMNSNDFILPDTECFFFDKALAANYNLPDFYNEVYNGDWYWDKVMSYIEVASSDLNGDGQYDENDQYGYAGIKSYCYGTAVMLASNIETVVKRDGVYVLNLDVEKTQGLVDKIHRLVEDSSVSYTWKYEQQYDPNYGKLPKLGIHTGRVLFEYATLSIAKLYRSSEYDFGILPLPKYDEAQEGYKSLNTSGFMCVPTTASDIDLIGKTTELLGAENLRTVVPVFFEVLLKQKVARDSESEKMLDIIFDSMYYTLSWNMAVTNNIRFSVDYNGEVASYFAINESKWQEVPIGQFNNIFINYKN